MATARPRAAMTPTELRAIGESIYGPHWQSPLACALGVSARALQRWANGQNTIPAGIAANLATLDAIATAGRDAGAARAAAER